ncbi:hypothetical protein V2J09_018965 [Rumex salicifolius]
MARGGLIWKMVERWNPYGIQLSYFMLLAALLEIQECVALNLEGLALLEFRERIEDDPFGAFMNWNTNSNDHCLWMGVQCVDGKVQILDLRGFSLQGALTPALRKLRYMRALLLNNNSLSGHIPKEICELKMLESLDLRHNNLSGFIPAEIGGMPSLKCLFLDGNNFQGGIPSELEKLVLLSSTFTKDENCYHLLTTPAPLQKPQPQPDDNLVVISSGSFSATIKNPNPNHPSSSINNQSPNNPQEPVYYNNDYNTLTIALIILGLAVLIALIILALFLFLIHQRRSKRVRARDNNLLHRLSKAFVTGVPKLNSSELQTACEDFSNIINTLRGSLMYKGILTSGVEIAVVSTTIRSSKQINHKNFVNLLGYCKEEDPFVRMMVFEYTPNGNLYEHLHVDGFEHLDWYLRMRIVMGVSYCLEYVHHDLNPPVIIPVHADAVLLTDDYAAKLVHVSVWTDIASKAELPDEEQSRQSDQEPIPDAKEIVYSFGVLLLEIISAKPPNTNEGHIIKWASQYWHDKEKLGSLVDPSLKTFKMSELEVICDVIKECIDKDPTQRPTMKDVTCKLREATNISPEAATERVSPLWWAELEILSDSS